MVEFSRNVLRGQDANSTEFDPNTSYRVVIDIPEHNTGQMGGTMRLGKRRTLLRTKNSDMRKLYGDTDYLEERQHFVVKMMHSLVSPVSLKELELHFVCRVKHGDKRDKTK